MPPRNKSFLITVSVVALKFHYTEFLSFEIKLPIPIGDFFKKIEFFSKKIVWAHQIKIFFHSCFWDGIRKLMTKKFWVCRNPRGVSQLWTGVWQVITKIRAVVSRDK